MDRSELAVGVTAAGSGLAVDVTGGNTVMTDASGDMVVNEY